MRGDRPEVRPTADALTEVPPAPASLPGDMATIWEAAAAELVARRLLTRAALGALETYVTAMWLVRECRQILAEDGLRGRTKAGDLKQHPLVGTLTRTQETVTRLAAELGLTPAARSRPNLRGAENTHDDAAVLGL